MPKQLHSCKHNTPRLKRLFTKALIYRGEIIAGNDNPTISTDLQNLIKQLSIQPYFKRSLGILT